MDFIISQDDMQKLANYLVTRPWSESNSLIQLLTSLKPVAAPAAPAPAPTPTLAAVPDAQ